MTLQLYVSILHTFNLGRMSTGKDALNGWNKYMKYMKYNEYMNLFLNISAQKVKFSVYRFFSKSEQIGSFLQFSSLLSKSMMESSIF